MTDNNRRWESDASRLSNFELFDKFVYMNASVDEFLFGNSKFCVIAAKGVGKTLLLAYKRYLLESKYTKDGERSSVIFIPEKHSYVGYIQEISTTLAEDTLSRFVDWEFCRKFWALIIEISALSYVGINYDEIENDLPIRGERFNNILRGILSKPRDIDYVFNEIIRYGESAITTFVEEISNSILYAFKKIDVPIFIFLDKLDNALESSHNLIWVSIQAGLLEAAWSVMGINSHVKIYLSIRQEAYAIHTSRNMNQISSSVVTIKYTKRELLNMLNQLVEFWEKESGYKNVTELVGYLTFPNTITFSEEDVFDFMFRYSIGRPRDFVQFCDELSIYKHDPNSPVVPDAMSLKEKVREISSEKIIKNLFDELKMLLRTLTTIEDFDRFLSLMNRNVLSYNELKKICKEFNVAPCPSDCSKCNDINHPFCDLYNMGLLGYVYNPSSNGHRIQRFKTPYENMTQGLRADTQHFLIHPSLREYINRLHTKTERGKKYDVMKGILIGESLPWDSKEDLYYDINKLIFELANEDFKNFFVDLFQHMLETGKRKRFPSSKFENLNQSTLPIYECHIIECLKNYFLTGQYSRPKPISIFISYAYDDQKHKERVESFTNLLREMGFEAVMDSSLRQTYPELNEMMDEGLKKDKVIIVLSPKYKEKADNHIDGVWEECKLIRADLRNHEQKYIFVSFEPFTMAWRKKISPSFIGNRYIVDLAKGKDDDYNELVSFIKEEREYPFTQVNESVVKTKPKEIKPFS